VPICPAPMLAALPRRQLLAALGLGSGGAAITGAAWWRWGGSGSRDNASGPAPAAVSCPFGGRADELLALRALSEGTGWAPVWLLRGDRGVGKSRLVHEHATRERLGGRTVVELSLCEGPETSALAATLARGLGLVDTASFEGVTTQLDDRLRSAGSIEESDGSPSTAALLPLVVADDVPADSTGACTTEAGAALADWACAAAAAGQARVIIVPHDSLPSYRDALASTEARRLVQQTRMLWLDWLPELDSRELSRTLLLHSSEPLLSLSDDGTSPDDSTATVGVAKINPGAEPEPEPEVVPDAIHMAAASGCPSEMVALASAVAAAGEAAEEGGGEAEEDNPTVVPTQAHPSAAVERVVRERERDVLELMGMPLLPPHGQSHPSSLIGLLSTDEDGATSAAGCWVSKPSPQQPGYCKDCIISDHFSAFEPGLVAPFLYAA
jgi:hypothetical protein